MAASTRHIEPVLALTDPLTALFELGTLGNTLATSDPANANPYDVVTVSGTNQLKYDNTHAARGSQSMRCYRPGGASTASHIRWTDQFGHRLTHYGRMYLWRDASPDANVTIMRVLNVTGGSALANIRLTSAQRIEVDDVGAGASPVTSANDIPLSRWVRIEWRVKHSSSAGEIEVRLYWTDPDAAVAAYDEQVLMTVGLDTGNLPWIQEVGGFGATTAAFEHWIDAVAVGAEDWVGAPAGTTPGADTTPPGVNISTVPDRFRISRVVGRDVTTFKFTVDEAHQAYEIRVVPSSSSPHTAGTLVESGGSGSAGVERTVDVTDDELVAAGLSEGSHVVKVFAQDNAGNWST